MAETQPSEATLETARQVWRDCCELGLGDSEIVERIADALAEQRREALEEACKAVCWMCDDGKPIDPTYIHRGIYYHEWDDRGTAKSCECKAHAIRALMDGPSGQDDDRYAFRRARGAIPYREGQPMPEDVIRRMRGKDDEPM